MEQLTRLSLRYRTLTLIAIAAITGVFGYGLLNVRVETGFRTFLGDENEDIVFFDDFVERFGGGTPIIVAYACEKAAPCASVFDEPAMTMAEDLRRQFLRYPGVSEVKATTNTELLVGVEGGFDVRTLYESAQPAPDFEQLVALARVDPLWDRALVSDLGRVGAIIVQLDTTDASIQHKTTRLVVEALEPYEALGFEYHLVGMSVGLAIAPDAVAEGAARAMPLMVVLLIGTLYWLSRSIAVVLVSLTTMGLASAWSQGLMGLLDIPADALTLNIPTIIFVVGVCDAIHFLTLYSEAVSEETSSGSPGTIESLNAVARDIGPACLLTTVTTCVAFLSFILARIDSFIHFGEIAAFGVAATLVLTFSFAPVVASLLPTRWFAQRAQTKDSWAGSLRTVASMSSSRPSRVLTVAGVLLVVAAIGVSRSSMNFDYESTIGRQNIVAKWNHWVNENLRSPETVEVQLTLPDGHSLETPGMLATVERIEADLGRRFPLLGETHSVLAPMRRIHQLLGEPGSEPDGLPYEASAIAEIFFLLQPSLVEQWLTLDRRTLRISVESPPPGPALQYAEMLALVASYFDEQLPDGWSYELTGSIPMFVSLNYGLLEMLFRCFAIAFVAIFVCLWVFFRSARVAALGMLPNLVPVMAMVGTLGLAGVPLDSGMPLTVAIILGIAVDDTIHLFYFTGKGLRARLEPRAALDRAIAHIGRPVVTTSLALSLGFVGLAVFSEFAAISSLGFLAAVAVMIALLADLILVPALVSAFPGAFRLTARQTPGATSPEH